jgi:hypothetical protein
MQLSHLEATRLSPYPHRDIQRLKTGGLLSEAEAGDFTPSGFLHIISKLEQVAHSTAWAREALTAERRAFLLIYGGVEPYEPTELASPMRRPGELELEFKARRHFYGQS